MNCPHCQKKVVLYEEQMGKLVECPECSNLFHAPEAGTVVKNCPNCQNELKEEDILCVNCGYNFDLGSFEEIKILEPDEYVPLWLRALRYFFEIFPGLLRPMPLILFPCCVFVSMLLAYFSMLLIGFMVIISGIAVGAAALLIYAQGVSLLLSGDVEIMHHAMHDYDSKQWTAFFILVFGPLVTIFFLFFFIASLLMK